MRPTPDEVVVSLRQLLKDEIAPALAEAARPKLRRVLSALRDFRWNEAGFDLLHENAVLGGLAADCLQALTASAIAGFDRASLAAAAQAAAKVSRSFAEANVMNSHLRRAVCGFVEAVRELPPGPHETLCDDIALATLRLIEFT